ncbi:hypothetical protein VZT92_027765 [Zoarces viviparus]|uniref:Uncharacterized protein n=1 Tax=Zoarces viviparus TaxID=48416 RepID=A0AAW1DW00_ZOAVI
MWLVTSVEDGPDWQDAHMGSREIIAGGGEGKGRGLATEALAPSRQLGLQFSLFSSGFPSMLTQAQDQVTRIRWYQSHPVYVCCILALFTERRMMQRRREEEEEEQTEILRAEKSEM